MSKEPKKYYGITKGKLAEVDALANAVSSSRPSIVELAREQAASQELTVSKWVADSLWDDSDSEGTELEMSWLGGSMQPVTFECYLSDFTEGARPRMVALRDEIVAKNIRRSGRWHQESNEGVPVWSDGAYMRLSMRAWGDLMAAIWNEIDGTTLDYCAWAWECESDPEAI